MNKQSISIDETKFSKASKKLLSQINEIVPENNKLKLTQIQEILSKSLGYRNFHDLNKFLNETKGYEISRNQIPKESLKNELGQGFLNKLSYEQILKIISSLIQSGSKEDLIWVRRAMVLMETVLLVLNYLRSQKEIEISVDTIREYLNMENLSKLQKRTDLPKEITTCIKNYLFNLPGFEEHAVKQQMSVFEKHGYLSMQFINVLDKLELIDRNNFIIAQKSWFYLNEHDVIKLNSKLLNIDYIEDSWIYFNSYQTWMRSLYLNKKMKTIRVFDLLHYISTIMLPERKDNMIFLINGLLENYSLASELSSKIVERMSIGQELD